jgi:HAD superfamily hydrolase (TIGR01458 family)
MLKAVLLDLGGVVYVGRDPLPGAINAIDRMRARGLALRFLTNTTRSSRRMLLDKLRAMGLSIGPDELFVPSSAVLQHLKSKGLGADLLVHPDLLEDFQGLPDASPQVVVIGDAGEGFTYQALNKAFRVLNTGAEFLALAKNKSFRDEDNELSLDAGAFVTALEYSTGRTATVFGKPSEAFFSAALESVGCRPEEAVMVGDDVEADVGGGMATGMSGILVRTGKYRPGDDKAITPPPSYVADDLSDAAAWILSRAATTEGPRRKTG